MRRLRSNPGFTVVELAVTAAIIVLILATLISMTDQTQRLMRGTSAKVEQFQEARLGFETLTRRISQATLNTYWDYQYQTVSQQVGGKTVQTRVPTRYERGSELRFRCGRMAELNPKSKRFQPTHGIFFQTPDGHVADADRNGAMDHLLNTWGYFVELNSDEESLPNWLRGKVPPRDRFRLMEMAESSENLTVYQFQQPRAADWFMQSLNKKNRPVRAVAENVIALILLPRLARQDEETQLAAGSSALLAPLYRYDSTQGSDDPVLNSKHQLPPVVQVVMIAIDGPSAERLATEKSDQPNFGLEYGSLFTRPELLEDTSSTAEPGDGDINKFTAILTDKFRISSRVFSTNVSIRGAKWSRSQEN
jgi:uncharacterized protein (TIGR02599 family)